MMYWDSKNKKRKIQEDEDEETMDLSLILEVYCIIQILELLVITELLWHLQ